MKKSIFLFFAAFLCASSVWGANAELKNGQILYCTVNNSNWKTWSIKFNWYWNEGDWCCNDEGTNLATDIWYAKIPNDYTRAVQLIRCKGDFSEEWNWSKTVKASDRSNNYQNCVNITGSNWGDADVSWTTYAPPMSSVTLADNGTTVNSGTGTQADPYIIEIGTKIKVQASGTKAVDDPDAVINYAFKYGATSQDSETTTWEIDANSPSTTYAIELEGYTKVSTTASTKKAATKLYYQTVADATLPTYQVTVTANDPAMGTVTGTGEYSEGATAELTATPNAGYQFVNWTVDETEKSTNAIYSFTVTENVTLVANFQAIPEETVYFINAGKWSDVYLHLWNGNATGTEWPGTQLTATGEKIGDYDVYSYTAQQGAHANLLFHKKDDDSKKTTDLTWSDGVDKYYIHNYNSNTGWYTKAEAEEVLVVPAVYDTVYFVNNKNWTKVQIHAWKGSANNGWPGQALTATGEKVEGFDVYSFEAAQGTYTNLIFNNKEGDAGVQSANYVWTADKYYYMGADSAYAGGTKEEVAALVAPDPLATDVYLVGEMNDWSTTANEFKKDAEDATTASLTLTLEEKTPYEFKVMRKGDWTSCKNNLDIKETVSELQFSSNVSDNCKLTTTVKGDYVFTWEMSTSKLSITYPASTPTALDNIVTSKAPIKVIENGQLFVIKNGVKYNVLGAIVK